MKFLLVLALTLVATQAYDLDTEWEAFKIRHGKFFSNGQEHDVRKNIFADNLRFIEKHNAEHALGLHSYTVGVNKFADLTNQEFSQQYKGLRNRKGATWTGQEPSFEVVENVPDSIDWRKKGAVTPVKDQGYCGSCWAFSTIGTVESAHFKKTGELLRLSEQNLIDCADSDHCAGGDIAPALDYIVKNGIDTEAYYPTEGYNSFPFICYYNKSEIGATITGYRNITAGSEEDLTKVLGTIGPVAVAIDASQEGFKFYHSGVYDEPACYSNLGDLDHAVLTVGYGTENGQDYYIVKNSWGEFWGDNGYIKMSRNKNNQCGIATEGYIAIA